MRGASDDEAEQDPMRDTVSGHKADLEALKERDPEFYEYLKASDADLLSFGGGMDLSGSDEEALAASEVRRCSKVVQFVGSRCACTSLKYCS